MNVVFFAVGQGFAQQAEDAASALRLTNPGVDAWCLTDQDTQFKTLRPYRIHSSKATLMYDRTLGQYQFLREHGSALFLDSDCVVNRSLEGVFSGTVAVTKRLPPVNIPHQIYSGAVLYGTGVDALKFWQDWIDMYPQLPRGSWKWWGDQMLLPVLAEHHQVSVYESDTHNYVPTRLTECEVVMPAHIVHFKGQRKPWMPFYLETLGDAYGAQDLRRSA